MSLWKNLHSASVRRKNRRLSPNVESFEDRCMLSAVGLEVLADAVASPPAETAPLSINLSADVGVDAGATVDAILNSAGASGIVYDNGVVSELVGDVTAEAAANVSIAVQVEASAPESGLLDVVSSLQVEADVNADLELYALPGIDGVQVGVDVDAAVSPTALSEDGELVSVELGVGAEVGGGENGGGLGGGVEIDIGIGSGSGEEGGSGGGELPGDPGGGPADGGTGGSPVGGLDDGLADGGPAFTELDSQEAGPVAFVATDAFFSVADAAEAGAVALPAEFLEKLSNASLADLTSLQRAMDRFLAEVATIGDDGSNLLAREDVLLWLAAAAAAVGIEVARRRMQIEGADNGSLESLLRRKRPAGTVLP